MNPERFSTGLIGFAVYPLEDESKIKTPRFGDVSGDFEYGI